MPVSCNKVGRKKRATKLTTMVSQGSEFYIGKSCIYYLPTYLLATCLRVVIRQVVKKNTTELTHHGYPGNWNPTEKTDS
jgi:hypothetical protein